MKYATRDNYKSKFLSAHDAIRYMIHGWEIPDFDYHFNGWGFRGTFDPERDMCIGDSRTFGWGIDEQYTYASLLGANNFGICGAGWQTFSRVANEWLSEYKPKNLYLLQAWGSRREIDFHGEYLLVSEHTNQNIGHELFPRTTHEEDEQVRLRNLSMIQSLCQMHNINLVYISMEDFIPSNQGARDGAHPDEQWNADIAKEFQKRC